MLRSFLAAVATAALTVATLGATTATAAAASPATAGSQVEPAGRITEFSHGITRKTSLYALAAAGGDIWFTAEDAGGEKGTGRIDRITPGGKVTEHSHGISTGGVVQDNPAKHPPDRLPAGLQGIARGRDRNLWFTECGPAGIGRMTPRGKVTEFRRGIPVYGCPTGIVAGPDGALWFTAFTRESIGRITTGGKVTMFNLDPSGQQSLSCTPLGITAGPDGNIWYGDQFGDRIGRITPAGKLTLFTAGISHNSDIQGITAGPDGNLWFTEGEGANRIGRITPAGKVTEYRKGLSAKSAPMSITRGPDGNLWFTEYDGDRIGRISPGPATGHSTSRPAVRTLALSATGRRPRIQAGRGAPPIPL